MIRVEGDEYALELRLNQGLLPEGHVISYRDADRNRTVLHGLKNEEIELCQYTGHVRGKLNSWVAVSTCYGLRGVIHDGTKLRYIEPVEGNEMQSLHQVYDHNYVGENHKCEINALGLENTNEQLTKGRGYKQRRQKREGSFRKRSFFNANEKSRYIELVLVADHAQYVGAGRNLRVLHHQLQETANIANAIFSPHNIFIALTGVEVWTVEDRIILDPTTQMTLKRFYEYFTVLLKNIGNHDHAQLVTETFHKGRTGLAYMESMCTPGSCSVIYRSARDMSAASIVNSAYNMVHELGHSFGMLHDSENCTCPDEYCIMTEKEQSLMPTHWSDCSLKVLNPGYADGMYSLCLRNKPVRLFGSASCGNGFIDPGEQCDCGVTMDNDRHPCYECCDPETCMLRSNAQCVGGVCCNLQSCRFKPAGTICRAAELDCDLPEYCDGMSEFCPEDVIKIGAVPCSGEMCARQRCVPADEQRWQSIRQPSKGCLNNCSGHGVCISGYCHCDNGYVPPMCDLPGFGGSVSEPTRHLESSNCSCDRDVSSTYYAGGLHNSVCHLGGRDIYVIALGSTSAIALIVFLIYLLKYYIIFHSSFLSRGRSVGSVQEVNTDNSAKINETKKQRKINETKIELTPEILSSVNLKKINKPEFY